MPSQVLLYADIIDIFVDEEKDKVLQSVKNTVKLLCYIGIGVWIMSYLYFTLLGIFSERIAKKIRIAYFKSLIN